MTARGRNLTSAFLIRIVFLFIAVPAALHAQIISGSGDGFNYILNPDNTNTIEIFRYTDTNQVVLVPSTINGLTVSSLGVTGVLGDDYSPVFDNLNITSVTIAPGVSSIGVLTFRQCSALTNVVIPSTVNLIDDSAFFDCTALSNITIPPTVTYIAEGAFFGCSALTEISIPGSVVNVGGSAFIYCASLINVVIQDGVESIGDAAFYGCGLTSVYLPPSVSSAGNAFAGCNRLIGIFADPENSNYTSVDGVLYNKSQITLVAYPGGLRGSFVVPSQVNSISGDAFGGATNLTSVIISSNVTNIGPYVFSGAQISALYFMGNPPAIQNDTFSYSEIGTVYYLPGTSGWQSSFGGIPTALWQPVIQNASAQFDGQSNQFGFRVSWAPNLDVVIEASTNLVSSIWNPITNITLTNGVFDFTDPQWTNYPARFYRVNSR